MNRILFTVLALVPLVSNAADQSPYAGEESRPLKSMSPQEMESLRSGGGMGFAKLAELNNYPGPRHVLELADDLGLTGSQVSATEALFDEMRSSATILGAQLIEAEMALDREFARGSIAADALKNALLAIGTIRAQLRYVHLEAHLRQKRILTKEQIAKYDEVRGYRSKTHDHSRHAD